MANIGVDEFANVIAAQRRHAVEVSGVGQYIKDDNAIRRTRMAPVGDKVGADEARAASHEEGGQKVSLTCVGRPQQRDSLTDATAQVAGEVEPAIQEAPTRDFVG